MVNSKFAEEWKKVQLALKDAAKLSGREIQRGVMFAKSNIERVSLVHKRKELFAELGRGLYEAHVDGLPPEVEVYFRGTEFSEIMGEIAEIDSYLEKTKAEK
jgi:hypothetical protein